jgi:hypothetical protein
VLLPALSAPATQTLSSEKWLMVVIVRSIPTMRALATSHPYPPPPPSEANGAGRSLGECGEEVGIWL